MEVELPMLFFYKLKTTDRFTLVKEVAAVLSLLTVFGASQVCAADSNTLGTAAPVVVKIERLNSGQYILTRNGAPYFVKGAGGDGSKELLKACGGDSVRTWGSDTLGQDLDAAQQNGLTVAAGIWLGHESQGFNYSDPDQIASQRELVRNVVTQYRNHPALLVWSLGNEMEGDGSNPLIWQEIETLAKIVKQIDNNHPIMTVICEPITQKIGELNKYCPDIDIVGINSYGGASQAAQHYLQAGGTKPYMLTEFGPPGQWEQPTTSWGASLELTSTAKADWYRKAYVDSVQNQPLCLGSYAFLWGVKQEATATWYGMILPDGERLAAAETMQTLWTGQTSTVTAPKINSFALDGSNTVAPGSDLHFTLDSDTTGQEGLQYNWVLRDDRKAVANGGQAESPLGTVPDQIKWTSTDGAEVQAPTQPGSYRLFVYLKNKADRAAVANVPFLVTGTDVSTSSQDGQPMLQIASSVTSSAPKAHLPYSLFGGAPYASVYVPSGYMGDPGAIALDTHCTSVASHDGGASLKASFNASSGWGGVVWQSPADDWGNQPGGLNLTGATKLSFWARGAGGGEVVSFEYGILGSDKKFHDSSGGKLSNVTLTDQWQKYSIDLSGRDLSDIKTGFAWVVAADGKPVTFYLDDIKYE